MDNKTTSQILIVDDDANLLATMRDILKLKGFEPVIAPKGNAALAQLEKHKFDLALIDLQLGDMSGLKVLSAIKTRSPETECILLTGHASQDTAIEAIQMGVYGYFQKPFDLEQILLSVQRALEKVAAGKALRQAEEKYRNIFENAIEGIFQSTPTGKFFTVNQSLARMFGYGSPAEMIASVNDLNHNFYVRTGRRGEFTKQMNDNQMVTDFESEVYRKDGSTIWVSENARSIHNTSGQVIYYEGTFENITGRKQAEEKVRILSRAVEQSPTSIVITDLAGNIEYVNPKFSQATGYSLGEALGENPRILKSGNTTEAEYQKLWDTITSGNVWQGEFLNKKKNGEEYWENATIAPVFNDDGKITNFLAVKEDITERKQAEERLRKSESLFASLFHANPTRISITRFEDSRFLDVNETFLKSVGYAREEVVGHTSSELNDWVDPQERNRLRNLLEDQGRVKDFETQLRKKSGDIMDVLISAELIQLFGQTCILSVGLDVTERKRAETEIRERTEELELINTLNEAANRGDNLDKVIEIFARELRKISVCKDATVYLISPDGENLVMQHLGLPPNLTGKIEQLLGAPIPQIQIPIREGSFFHHALQSELGVITTDPKTIQQWMLEFAETKTLPTALRGVIRKLIPQIYQLLDIRSTLVIPLISDKKVIGLLDVSSPEILTERDLGRIQKISSQLTAVILREQANESLLESEKRYRTIFDGVQEAIFIETKDGKILEVNTSACEMYGYKRDEFLTKTVSDFVLEGSAIFAPHLNPNKSSAPIETINRRANGEIFPIEISGGVQVINGEEVLLVIVRDITERKRVEEALQESEERFRIIFEKANDAIHIENADDKILAVNSRMCELMGYSREELLKMNVADLQASERRQLGGVLKSEFARHNSAVFEALNQHRNGRLIPVEVSIGVIEQPSGDLYISVVRDITERKQAERSIRQRIKELELLYESGLAFSQLLNPREIAHKIIELLGKKLDWHHTAIRLIREQDELELVAFDQPGLEDKVEVQAVEAHFNKLITRVGEGLSGWALQQSKIIRSGDVNSDPHYVATYPGLHSGLYVPLKLGDHMLGVISIESEKPNAFGEADEQLLTTLANQTAIAFENARLYVETNRYAQEMEKRVQERTADLSRVNLDLAHAVRVKDEFLASMSHELRTPLTGILGLSEVLQLKIYGELNEKQSSTLKTVEESGRHLLDLINDILDLSKIEAGKLELQFAPCSITDICLASLQLIKGMAQHKGQHVHYSPPPELIVVRADARRLKQMLVNLLSNAIKFTPPNGELGLEVEADEAERKFKLIVWDKGIGINPEDLNKLFKPFVQLDSGLAREYSGTGLGLSLVQHLTELHNGGIEVESKFGEGSRFTIILPWSPQNTTPIPYIPKRGTTGDLSGSAISLENSNFPLVMFADDNEMVLQMVADFLETRQYRVIKVRNGTELLDQVAENHPDIMLVDIQMPGIGGMETIRRIRSHADPLVAAAPVIAVTALAMPADRERCLRAGADDYISKPLKLKTLVVAIQKLLERKP